jgi:hypothetical protein
MADAPQPNPRSAQLPAPGSGEPPFRRLHCVHYDRCLDAAISERWESFTCLECDVHETSPREQELLDAIKGGRFGVGA